VTVTVPLVLSADSEFANLDAIPIVTAPFLEPLVPTDSVLLDANPTVSAPLQPVAPTISALLFATLILTVLTEDYVSAVFAP